MKTRRPRAAFVMTFSLLAASACGKEASSSGECKPPDCHMNPPPQPEPTTVKHTMNPPDLSMVDAASATPSITTLSRNPPPVPDPPTKK